MNYSDGGTMEIDRYPCDTGVDIKALVLRLMTRIPLLVPPGSPSNKVASLEGETAP